MVSLSAATLVAVGLAYAQPAAEWRAFGPHDGLLAAAPAFVSVNAQGKVRVTHLDGNSISEFDGYSATSIPNPPVACGRIAASPSGQLWATDTNGLLEWSEGPWRMHPLKELETLAPADRERVPLLPLKHGRVLFLLPDRLMEFNTEEPDRPRTVLIRTATETKLGAFSGLTFASDGGAWISGGRGVAKIPGPLRSIRADSEWEEYVPESLTVTNFSQLQPDGANGVVVLGDEIGKAKAVVHFDGSVWRTFPAGNEPVRFAWRGADGLLRAATGDSILEFHPSHREPVESARPGWRKILDVGVESNGAFWIASTEGLFRHAPPLWKKGEVQLATAASSTTRPPSLPAFPESELQLGKPVAWFQSRNQEVWAGCESGVARFHEKRWQHWTASDHAAPAAPEHFIEMPDDRIWCSAGSRIWQFNGQQWSVVRGGMDAIKSLLRAPDGSVWVAAESGLFRFVQNTWIQQSFEDGLPKHGIEKLFVTDGQLWAATENGNYRFQPSADPDSPKTSVHRIGDGGKVREGDSLTCAFLGCDKWKLTRAERLLYSHRLDQGDWSPFLEQDKVVLSELSAGKHQLQVRAMDRNGNIETVPARLDFLVVLPWYRELRVVTISIVGGSIALFFAGLALNRHLQLRRSYAEIEREIAERTRQLENANRELLHSQKMTALGTLAAGIAHDFNNILSIVKGSAQIIEDNLEHPQKIRTRVDRIKTVVDQGSGIVKAMLGFSRESDASQTPVSINHIVADTLKLLGDRFLREVRVSFEPGTHLPDVMVPRELIQQILLNCIFNAAEAMSDRKEIVLRTKLVAALPEFLALPPAPAANYIAVEIQDFGCGIPAENISRIFEPFFTTKAFSTRHGTGLGLSMVYELAKKLEAGLAVESVVKEGSTFTLFIPVRTTP